MIDVGLGIASLEETLIEVEMYLLQKNYIKFRDFLPKASIPA